MSILKMIMKIFNINTRKVGTNVETSEIVRFDTSGANIPNYKELSGKEKQKVDNYIKEMRITKTEDLVYYGKEISTYSNGITQLLVEVLYNSLNNFLVENSKEKSNEEIIKLKIEKKIAKEEILSYEKALLNLNEEAKLKAIALEEKANKEFEKARIEEAIERIRISKIGIEQQLQGVKFAEVNIETTIEAIDIALKKYNELLNQNESEEIENNILEEKEEKLKRIMRAINMEVPEKNIENDNDERIRKITEMKVRIALYAYKNKSEIENIKQIIEKIGEIEKTEENKEELLKDIEELEIKFQIFRKYLNEEDFKNLYKNKFKILTSDIFEKGESSIKYENLSEEEIGYYKKIIEEKLSTIISGKNDVFRKHFEEKNIPKVIKLIKAELTNEKRSFDTEEILKDENKLRILSVFDKDVLLEKVKIRTEDILEYRKKDDDMQWPFKFDDKIPAETFVKLTQNNEEYAGYRKFLEFKGKNDFWMRVLKLHKNIESEKGVHRIPEGICEIRYRL